MNSLQVRIADADESEIPEGHSSEYHLFVGPSDIRPSNLDPLEERADRPNRAPESTDARSLLIPEFIDSHLRGVLEMLDQVVSSLLFNVRLDSQPDTRAEYALRDRSNDHLARATTQEIISRAGFDYETHYAESTDGYFTELVRIVNPLADQSRLKQPPVAMYHGILADTSMWITSSSIQHHPERWPRDTVEDGPITSSNRSLGFVLANNGYDVWLVGMRGCNRFNQGHRTIHKPWSIYGANVTVSDLIATFLYWKNFTIDEIGVNEVPRQLDRIMHLTGSPKISVISYSVSTLTTLALLSERPEYSEKIHNYVTMDPPMTEHNTNIIEKILYRTACQLDYFDGTLFITETVLSQQLRDAILAIGASKAIRYTFYKSVVDLLGGYSPDLNTLWEMNYFGHNFSPVGFRVGKHLCQILSSNRFHKFDYGPIENLVRYGSFKPPDYDLSKVKPGDNWFIITSTNDPFSTREDIEDLIQTVGKKPYGHLFVPYNNHIDMMYSFESDIRVNLPLLEFMNQFSYEPEQSDFINLFGG